MMGLLYRKMAWNYAEPRDDSNPHAMPCIFLQFTDKLDNGREQKGVTQVFTKQVRSTVAAGRSHAGSSLEIVLCV